MYGVFIVHGGDVMLFSTTGNLEDAKREMQDARDNGYTAAFVIRLEAVIEA